ncbi:hypothetical protein F5B19DRAFT_500222 [Rostrohypoxylon terebratum]|nr:hypothetical protein F5B19DRAFT_500222 [Rostrohypoxylon terebratum]
MSSKTTADASKANGEGAAKPSKNWSNEETLKGLLLIWQHENPELSVSGWKEIGEKAQAVFNGKFTMVALKHQFQRIRAAYLNDLPESLKEAPKPNEKKPTASSGKGKKRAAPADDGATDNGPKFKKQQAVKKAATNAIKGSAKAAAASYDNGEEEHVTADLKPQRRAQPKTQTKDIADEKKKSRPTHNRATCKNPNTTDPQSADNTIEAPEQQNSDSDNSRNNNQDVVTGDQAGTELGTVQRVTFGDAEDFPAYSDDEAMCV